MPEHVCAWKFIMPYYRGAEKIFIVCENKDCGMVLTKAMGEHRLNATERLSADRVNEILEDRTVTTGDIVALRAYVAEREKGE